MVARMTVICARKLNEGLLSILAQIAENVRYGPRQKILIRVGPPFRISQPKYSSSEAGESDIFSRVKHPSIHTAIGHFSWCIKWTDPEITWVICEQRSPDFAESRKFGATGHTSPVAPIPFPNDEILVGFLRTSGSSVYGRVTPKIVGRFRFLCNLSE